MAWQANMGSPTCICTFMLNCRAVWQHNNCWNMCRGSGLSQISRRHRLPHRWHHQFQSVPVVSCHCRQRQHNQPLKHIWCCLVLISLLQPLKTVSRIRKKRLHQLTILSMLQVVHVAQARELKHLQAKLNKHEANHNMNKHNCSLFIFSCINVHVTIYCVYPRILFTNSWNYTCVCCRLIVSRYLG